MIRVVRIVRGISKSRLSAADLTPNTSRKTGVGWPDTRSRPTQLEPFGSRKKYAAILLQF